MSYVLGSETESMVFATEGIRYVPSGSIHAVRTVAALDGPDPVLAYAICGQAVHAWPNQPFDASARGVHEQCAAAASRD